MTTANVFDLPLGARYRTVSGGPDFEVTLPACEHRDGWVEVRNLSMTDAEARQLLDRGLVENGTDPRDGLVVSSTPVIVQVLS